MRAAAGPRGLSWGPGDSGGFLDGLKLTGKTGTRIVQTSTDPVSEPGGNLAAEAGVFQLRLRASPPAGRFEKQCPRIAAAHLPDPLPPQPVPCKR